MNLHSPQPQRESFWCRTLGGLALYGDPGDPRPLMEAGKPLAVLAYLALAPGGRAGRDHVAELLWPGADLAEGPLDLYWEEVEWAQMCDALLRASDGDFPVKHLAEPQPWIRKVARYSFALGSVDNAS